MNSKMISVSSNEINNKTIYLVLQIPYNFLKVFALSCIRRDRRGVLVPYLSPIKIALSWVVIAAVCFGGFYYRINYRYRYINLTIQATDVFQTLSDFVQYSIEICCTYYYGRLYVLEYIKNYESIDLTLRFKAYHQNKRFMSRLTAFFIIYWMTMCSIDFYGWFNVSKSVTAALSWSSAYIFKLIRVLVVLEVTAHVMILSSRLERIAEVLHYNYRCLATLQSAAVDPLASRYCLANRMFFDGQDNELEARGADNVECLRVRQLTRCYVLLVEQSEYINCAFGLRILLMFINVMTDMIRWINVGLFILFGILKLHTNIAFPVLGCLLQFSLGAGLFICLVIHCEHSYRQRECILRLVTHTLLNKALNLEYRTVVEELRDVITTRDLRWTAFDMFSLDFKLLHGIVSAIVAYTIILTQMGSYK